MTNLITYNPYRILGVYSNSPQKDVLSNLNKMKAFLKVGKEVSFPLDLPNYFPVLKRNETLVSEAQSSIGLPLDQLKHSLFWFMKATPLDDIAFNHLLNGNIQHAKEIWQKKECVSSLLNLMSCAIIEQDYSTFALSADRLFQNHSIELCSSVNETLKLSAAQLTDLLVESLKEDGNIDIAGLARVPGTSACWQKAFAASTVKPLIDEINFAINEAKNVKGSSANYSAGIKLMNSTNGPLSLLRELLAPDSMQYQMIADKLAQTILQCGINYFNDSNDDDAPQKAMVLQKYALSIAVGQLAKDRCKENVDILEKIGPEYIVRHELSRITKIIDDFQNKKSSHSSAYKDHFPGSKIVSVSPIFNDSLTSTTPNINKINDFVGVCEPLLIDINKKLGSNSKLYINLSSTVASLAINKLVNAINRFQELNQKGPYGGSFMMLSTSDPVSELKKRNNLILVLNLAMASMNKIGNLYMDYETKNYYSRTFKDLNNILDKLCPKPTPQPKPQSTSSDGCYIATMAYGDYNHPQVMVLRDFRDSYLDKRDWGKRFISYYYAHSPNWVEKLKSHNIINALIRKGLDVFVLLWKNVSNYE